jgi:hypothetical protein
MIDTPVSRRLRVLAFDPSLTTRLETATINELTLIIPWEPLELGPIGEYIEVVDCDPASGVFYYPVDLNHPHLLAQDGLPPSESNPQFHQQMVYAVAMTTIRHFERALGRSAFWSDRSERLASGEYIDQFVRRLRIYPHALRDRNAYYSPSKKALLFGYFPVTAKDAYNTPGTIVFSCLSHDIITHEVTHALLDGVHPRFNEPTNPDVHAFHEAFADIVALFQHFSYPAVLESQIEKTRGNLQTENLLSQLAQQFGRATGRGSALRDALGSVNKKTGEWEPQKSDPHALEKTYEAHTRGAILVAAVFRAFLLIYRAKSADLFRIATSGTGVLPEGDLHPDLTRRLATEAAKCANRVLQMCIRAIDYCPPVDITFGDFLRGVITADLDYVPEDTAGYRTVFIQSFREWGIHPRSVTSMGIDALVWPSGDELFGNLIAAEEDMAASKQYMKTAFLKLDKQDTDWNLESDRFKVWEAQDQLRRKFWKWLRDGDNYGRYYAKLFGLVINDQEAPRTVYRNNRNEPTVEIHAVRPALRRTVNGGVRTDLVVEITQRRRGYFEPDEQALMDQPGDPIDRDEHGDFIYRAGATILIDPTTQEVRRIIRTPGTIADNDELERVRRYLLGETGISDNAFDAGLTASIRSGKSSLRNEPFALLHQRLEE